MVRVVSYHQSRNRAKLSVRRNPQHFRKTLRHWENIVARESTKPCLHTHIVLHPFWLYTLWNWYLFPQLSHHKYNIKFNFFTEFLSFSPALGILGNGKTYSNILHPKMSVSAEKTNYTSALRDPERIEESTNGIAYELMEERIKANLKLLNKQIYTLTQLLNQFIQKVSARNSPTAVTRTQQTLARHAHPVIKREPLEPCQQNKSGVRHFRPTPREL